MIDKNLVLINYLSENAETLGISDYYIKSEYSLNDNDIDVVVVQMSSGEKQVLYDGEKLYDYFLIQIFGQSIRNEKAISVALNELIGENVTTTYNNNDYQIMFMQFNNPQTIMYEDIQRVGYTLTLKTIIKEIERS